MDLDGDLELADDDEDELVLGSGSDIALATDSGINLMSPSDSGLSLEDEPLDLAGTGISGLDLATEGSGVGSGAGSAAASGSLVDFQQDEEFQLSPSGGIEMDEDSGSQVIELEIPPSLEAPRFLWQAGTSLVEVLVPKIWDWVLTRWPWESAALRLQRQPCAALLTFLSPPCSLQPC